MKSIGPIESQMRALMRKKGLTMRTLAQESEVAVGTVHNLMKQGKGNFDTMSRVCNVLGVKVDDLFEVEDVSKNSKNSSESDKDKLIEALQKQVEYLQQVVLSHLEYLKLAADGQSGAVIIPIEKAAVHRPAKAS